MSLKKKREKKKIFREPRARTFLYLHLNKSPPRNFPSNYQARRGQQRATQFENVCTYKREQILFAALLLFRGFGVFPFIQYYGAAEYSVPLKMSLMAIFDGVCKFLVVHVNINAATFRGPRLFACDRPAAAFPIRSYFDYELQLRAFAAFLNRVNSSSCSSNYLAATNYYSSLGSSNAEVRETRVSSTFSPLLCTLSNKNREKTAGGSRERERDRGREEW